MKINGLIARFAAPKVPHPQILQRKPLQIATKPRNLRKFSLSKVSVLHLYMRWRSQSLSDPSAADEAWY